MRTETLKRNLLCHEVRRSDLSAAYGASDVGRVDSREGQVLMSSWTPALLAALASGLSRVASPAPSRSASTR
jgi:hypothetical protein